MKKDKSFKLTAKKQVEFDVLCKSLVGKEISVVDSSNKNQIGFSGILVYESAKLFYLQIGSDTKKILKSGLVIEFELNQSKVQVRANVLQGTLSSRIKKIK
jgi:RNase P/RNase MRP subunit p29